MGMDDVGRRGRSRALYEEIKARIGDGTYAPGTVLPSTRALAAERGLSRTTVSLVYEQLAADGFIETRPGAATRVAAGAVPSSQNEHDRSDGTDAARPKHHDGRLSEIGVRVSALEFQDLLPVVTGEIDFVYGPLAGRDFPTSLWLKALRTVERQRGARLSYEDPRGNIDLRRALQAHLSQTRGLSCSTEQLLIVNGSQQALDLCARLLVNPGDPVVVENPGYRMAHYVFEAYGANIVGIEVDGQGLRTDLLGQVPRAQMAYVTPTHQFPLGSFLPIGRRRALLEWAADGGTWVIEDDYDSEYRYSVRPEATLRSLDLRECVVHVGTFSKTLSPQLRLGYMVLPQRLVSTFAAAKRLADRHAPTGIQRALAVLLRDGSYDRHVRRMRRLQHARQRALLDALSAHLGDRVVVQGSASGLHLVAWFPSLRREQETALVQAARLSNVRVYPISQFFLPAGEATARQRPAGLVMGYALLEREHIQEGVQRLAAALTRLQSGPAPATATYNARP
ncbi:PLP-dependent aminotransferase family protein [Aromatoleum diolicum]|uniref:Aminotransferase class I/II-fold pyridoxal phosphate-dependent enzyme n=1 Tax=Aromatoleum diolicum TaxID=75796 RepID=A0ABX1QCW9_9RHOO|nr:PLP-dependent aminotransferase family protein [Aromatoleum diolicum]NMG76209.1 aminotransferase class I/II-fold pyridoxal phosphate-dependent enzyme [Aromatoleum diolicum]